MDEAEVVEMPILRLALAVVLLPNFLIRPWSNISSCLMSIRASPTHSPTSAVMMRRDSMISSGRIHSAASHSHNALQRTWEVQQAGALAL